jgi:membrane-associated phospholipid phosphatase
LKKIIISVFTVILLQQNIFAIDIKKAGDILQIAIPAVAYGTTLYLKDKDGQGQFYKSFGTNFIVTHGIKLIVDKKRPNGGGHSFPSGHTSAAFQGASFIHKRYGIKYAILPYIGATFVGYSRIYSKAHHKNDVVAGALIGIFSSFYFTSKYKGFEIQPVAFNDGYGVKVGFKW